MPLQTTPEDTSSRVFKTKIESQLYFRFYKEMSVWGLIRNLAKMFVHFSLEFMV